MKDFSIRKYKELLQSFVTNGYFFMTFGEFCQTDEEKLPEKYIVLRHDVDELACNALIMAQTEANMGVHATYFFRRVKQSDVPSVIQSIVSLGHEVGYHYEDLATAEGNMDVAVASFERNLAYFRQYYPVKTVCMHGSSSSVYDNRDIWKIKTLSDFGLIGEPYLTVDFDKVFYLTDTGYAWDGGKFAVRDVVENKFGLSFHTTDQIIECVKNGDFPSQSMILAHTLWTDSQMQWWKLHVREYVRNRVKYATKHSRLLASMYRVLVKLYWKNSRRDE